MKQGQLAVTLNFLNNIVLHGRCTQNLINRINLNGEQVLLYLRYPAPANFAQFLHYCIKIFFAFFNYCLKQRGDKVRLLILITSQGQNGGEGKEEVGGTMSPPPCSLFLVFCFASKGWEFVCHYHLTKRVMSRVLFKGKVLFLLCCCRKYPYSSIKGVLV